MLRFPGTVEADRSHLQPGCGAQDCKAKQKEKGLGPGAVCDGVSAEWLSLIPASYQETG